MFTSLKEEISHSSGQRWLSVACLLRYAGVLAVTALVFVALYAGIVWLE
ncbi:MAG TPA: hypothetical protein VLY04_20890 [Bryobacteraceae bacterium]|nr:hypothetical protein [Bryobacteraceae bacterium]